MHVSTTPHGRAGGCWADVRRHPEKVLPVRVGLFKTRYCLAGPSQVSYFRKSNLTSSPDEIVRCDRVERHPEDPCVVCLKLGSETAACLLLVDTTACTDFIAAVQPVIQLKDAPFVWSSIGKHGISSQTEAANQMQREAMQQQLARKETEMSPAKPSAADASGCRYSLPSRRGPRTSMHSSNCSSTSSDSDSDAEPIAPTLGRASEMSMDWPLSRAEKRLRLLQIMDKERALIERQNNKLRRRSCPDPSLLASVASVPALP